MTKKQILERLYYILVPVRGDNTTKYDDRRLRIDVEELTEQLEEDIQK